jgi:hypothetical protein
MYKQFFFLLFAGIGFTASAQSPSVQQRAELTGSIGSSQGSAVLSYVHNWQLGKKKKFEIGTGARFTSYFGSNQYFITAPAKLTSGSSGPGVLFKENIPANIDSLLLSSAQINALNITINLGYHLSKKFYAGFNIDAVGFSFGGEQSARFISNSAGQTTTAKPTGFNALLISDNDRGTLNSELFLRYNFNEKWSARAGYQFLFTEYTTNTEIQRQPEPNDRFRNKVSAVLIGVSYKL